MTFDPKEARALVERLLVPSAYIGPYFDIPHPIPIQKESAAVITALLAENERLRVAVEEIAAPPVVAMDSADRVEALKDIARAVLKGATDD